jgi:hypothetical protein
MRRQFALTLAYFIGLVFIVSVSQEHRFAPGYQTVNDTSLHNCPKGKHWDYKQKMCIGD